MNPEKLMSITAGRALSFDYISGGGRPEWTAEDAALACKGLSRARYAAFSYRWARDDTQRSTLYDCLLRAAIDLALTERWRDYDLYVERLIWVALAEDRHPIIALAHCWPAFARTPLDQLRALTAPNCHISRVLSALPIPTEADEAQWSRLSRKYEGVRGILDNWCHDAHRHMMRRIVKIDEVA